MVRDWFDTLLDAGREAAADYAVKKLTGGGDQNQHQVMYTTERDQQTGARPLTAEEVAALNAQRGGLPMAWIIGGLVLVGVVMFAGSR